MSSSRVGILLGLLVVALAPPVSADLGGAVSCSQCGPEVSSATNLDIWKEDANGEREDGVYVQQTTQAQVGSTKVFVQLTAEPVDSDGRPCDPVAVSGGPIDPYSLYPDVLGIVLINPRCAGIIYRGP